MKKNRLLLIISLFLFFCSTIKVDAMYCSSKLYSNLKMRAYKSEISYELKFDDNHVPYFNLMVNNVDKDVLVVFNGTTYEPVNGVVEIKERITGGRTYEVELYGGYDTECVEEHLYTKNVAIPRYNIYSERDECIEYEEFTLCNKWYPKEIKDEDEFLNKLDEYVKSLKTEEKEEKPVKEKSTIEKIIDFYTDHLIITLPITILIILFIVYKVVVKIIRRRNRVKLNS